MNDERRDPITGCLCRCHNPKAIGAWHTEQCAKEFDWHRPQPITRTMNKEEFANEKIKELKAIFESGVWHSNLQGEWYYPLRFAFVTFCQAYEAGAASERVRAVAASRGEMLSGSGHYAQATNYGLSKALRHFNEANGCSCKIAPSYVHFKDCPSLSQTTSKEEYKGCPYSDCGEVHYLDCQTHGTGTHEHNFRGCDWKATTSKELPHYHSEWWNDEQNLDNGSKELPTT